MQQEKRYLYRAPVVLPVAAPPLTDGAVLTGNGRVLAVGPWSRLRAEVPDSMAEVVDYDGHVLLPALVAGEARPEGPR